MKDVKFDVKHCNLSSPYFAIATEGSPYRRLIVYPIGRNSGYVARSLFSR